MCVDKLHNLTILHVHTFTKIFKLLFNYKFYQDVFSIHGGFVVTIPLRLILYIIYIVSIISSSQPLPTTLKAITRGFSFCFI
jgi:hypothetical protein